MARYSDEQMEQHAFQWSAPVCDVGNWAAEQIGRDTTRGDWKFKVWVDEHGYVYVLGRDFEALP